MNTYNDTDEQRSLLALDIVEAGTAISDEQLRQLLADEALQQEVQQVLDLRSAVQQSQRPVDVEARLKAVLEKVEETHPQPLRPLGRVLRVLAAAAVFVGVLMVLWPVVKSVTTGTGGQTETVAATPITHVFTADDEPIGISVTTEQGATVALSPQTPQSTSISLDDFRRVLSGVETERVTLSVPFGKSTDITLPDGSVACLHPGSRLVFPTRFVGTERVVMLEGEAYFKVKSDAAHPFIVLGDELQTTVLGTEFNVDTRRSVVTLVSGSIRVADRRGSRAVVLAPGQQLTAHEQGFAVGSVDTTPYEMWRDGYLYFDNVELRQIMEAIGQNFNMSVEFNDEQSLGLRMRFITQRNNGVDAAIESMNQMKKVTVSRRGGTIYVN